MFIFGLVGEIFIFSGKFWLHVRTVVSQVDMNHRKRRLRVVFIDERNGNLNNNKIAFKIISIFGLKRGISPLL